ncbi:MAG: 2-dehydropantoate 2-reductase [Lachnospiraceae bacterium]|nr:2-dehydropantoate 2-reductase [Lachnospiraceae bacterium]
MNIYIDFDDCLCETAKHFSILVKDLFGLNVPYEDIRYFNLQKTFALTDEQYEEMMIKAHSPEVLLSYDETPGAVETVNGWIDEGHNVSIITGRPFSAYEASREWLDRHGLERVRLYCLNKYGRDSFIKNSDFSLEIEDYYKMHFDYAIEDSPAAFRFFEHLPDLKVMVIDRPWNQGCEFPGENYFRCYDWDTIRRSLPQGSKINDREESDNGNGL